MDKLKIGIARACSREVYNTVANYCNSHSQKVSPIVLMGLADAVFDCVLYVLNGKVEQKTKFKVGQTITHPSSGNTFRIAKIDYGLYISDDGAVISIGGEDDWKLADEPMFKIGDFIRPISDGIGVGLQQIKMIQKDGYLTTELLKIKFCEQGEWEFVMNTKSDIGVILNKLTADEQDLLWRHIERVKALEREDTKNKIVDVIKNMA